MGDIRTRKINQKHLNNIKMEEKIIYFMCLLMDLSILYEITEIYCIILLSLPSWERGLKYIVDRSWHSTVLSLPSWERGLKSNTVGDNEAIIKSLPSWERGLKLHGYT